MPFSEDTSADEIGRVFAALLKGSRAGPDLLELWRAFAELQARERARRQDLRADVEGGAFIEDRARTEDWAPEPPLPDDPVVFMTRIHALILGSRIRFGLHWQELLSRQVPAIRARLDEYRAETDPPPELRWQLIDRVRELLSEIGKFAVQQGYELQHNLNKLETELIPRRSVEAVGAGGRRRRTVKIKSDPAPRAKR
jgi:hypothetical protein